MRNYSKNFVDLQDCTYNPLIIPFLSEEEKVLLDNGDLVFLEDEDEEDKVQKQVEEKNSNTVGSGGNGRPGGNGRTRSARFAGLF